MRFIIAVCLAAAVSSSVALATDEVKQNVVSTPGAPIKTDAEPGYWTNLFTNTMRFTVMHPTGKQEIDVFYNRDKTVTSNVGMTGVWHTEGEPGKEMFCYTLAAFKSDPVEIGECFPLRLMNNPRIGARWGAQMKQGINYQAVVVAGRETAMK